MVRSIGMFVVGLLACGCSGPAAHVLLPAAASPLASVRGLEDQTVALLSPDDVGVKLICAGVWISRSMILTARHCIDGEVQYATLEDLAESPLIRVRESRLQAVDEKHDLALLWAVSPPVGHAVARPRSSPIVQGLRVQTIGHPLGRFWYSYSSGDIAAIREQDIDGTDRMVWIQSTTPISPGNSGGGLFDTEGYLLGIADAIVNNAQSINLFIPVQYIDALIREQGADL